MAALTKAVYDSAVSDDDDPPEPTSTRLLPGGTTVAALLIVLVALAGIGVWRNARAADEAHASEQAAEQSAERQAEENTHQDPAAAPERDAPSRPASHASPSSPGSAGQVIVYVSGAVATPGVLTLPASSPAELSDLVWAHWGRSRWYLPAILPVVAAAWMWMSDPRRIVANAERITELSDTLTESITEKARAVQEGRTHKTSRGGRDR